jgi:3-oxoacyl-(acyl-carrier-protein) synthase
MPGSNILLAQSGVPQYLEGAELIQGMKTQSLVVLSQRVILSNAALTHDTRDEACRYCDHRDRDGFVMGEGAGILVIEELEHAIRRGAKPLAEVVGYGTTADAYHITSGPEDGAGARRAMEGALRQASLKPGDIQHLNAHSTSTPVGDCL